MKKIAILILAIVSLANVANAQYTKSTQSYKSQTYRSQTTVKKPAGDNTIYDSVDEMASFPGGKGEMFQFMKGELQYPQEAKDKKIQGRVVVDFVINRDGSIQDVRVKQSVDPQLDAEAIRMVKAMPKWTAALRDGKNVRSRYTLPVLFKIK